MSGFRDILFETPEPRVAQITLNRPAQMNAYTGRMCDELTAAIARYVDEDELRCLVVTGAGRGFCSGGDVGGAERERPDYRNRQMGFGQEMRIGMHRVIAALHRIDKPVVAMINGPAVAGGLTLALACDFRIAAESARLGDTSLKFALIPDEGGAYFFPRAMGLDRALKMSLLSEIYPARQAMELGLVTEVVPDAELMTAARALAGRLAEGPPVAIRLTKRMMYKQRGMDLDNALEDAAMATLVSNYTEDVKEGTAAFHEKRKPKFKGK